MTCDIKSSGSWHPYCTRWDGSSLINFLNAGDSTVVRGCMSSIIYSITNFLTSSDETPLLSSVACLLAWLPALSSCDLLCFTVSGRMATRFVVLWIDSKCFLKLEVVFLVQESGLALAEHRVHRALRFLSPLSTIL